MYLSYSFYLGPYRLNVFYTGTGNQSASELPAAGATGALPETDGQSADQRQCVAIVTA